MVNTKLYYADGTEVREGDILEDNEIYGIVCCGHYVDGDEEHDGFYVFFPDEPMLRQDLAFWVEEAKCLPVGTIDNNPELMPENYTPKATENLDFSKNTRSEDCPIIRKLEEYKAYFKEKEGTLRYLPIDEVQDILRDLESVLLCEKNDKHTP